MRSGVASAGCAIGSSAGIPLAADLGGPWKVGFDTPIRRARDDISRRRLARVAHDSKSVGNQRKVRHPFPRLMFQPVAN
ncbi:MAG: hypothetical protein KF791_16860 [Verrucomicrobiae bacterium]|nr:hypothetical protein [Verrucomicrobiae bacterium]